MAQPLNPEIKLDAQGINAADFFRPIKGVTFSKKVGGEFAEEYDAWIKHSAGKADVEDKLKQASALKLPDILGKEVVSVVMSLPVESRQNSVVLSGKLIERAVETEKRIATELEKLVADGKISKEEADGLKGYGFVEMARISANYAASKGAPDAEVVEKSSPIRWGDGVNETEPHVRWEKVMQLANEADRISGSDEARAEGEEKVSDKLADAIVPAVVAGVTAFGEEVGEAVATKLSSLKFGKSENESKKTDKTESPAKELKKGVISKLGFKELEQLHESGEWFGEAVTDQELLSATRKEMTSRYDELKDILDPLSSQNALQRVLVESEWQQDSYKTAIVEFAQRAEQSSRGMGSYNKARYHGLVESAIKKISLLAELDGLKAASIDQIENKLGGSAVVDRKIRILEEEIKRNVFWNPKLPWKALIDSETSWQQRERQDEESKRNTQDEQEKRMRKLMEFQSDKSAGVSNSGWSFKVERIAPKFKKREVFDDRFVTDFGLPHTLYEPPRQIGQTEIRGFDTATLLQQVFDTGTVMPILTWENIVYTLVGQNASEEQINKAFYSFNSLKNAIIPLMIGRFRIGEGSYASICGKDGQGGILNKGDGNLDLREIIPAIERDVKSKKALAILLASNGYEIGGMSDEDKKKASEFRDKFKDIIEHGVVKDGRPALNKTPGYTQRECVAYMSEVAQKIATHLGCDKGRVELMVTLYTALGGGQRMIEYREMWQRFPVVREADPKDVMMKPLLYKLKIGDGEYGFGHVEKQLKEKGVDGMFDALLLLKDGHDLWKYWSGQAMFFDALKKVDDMQLGNDALTSEADRRREIAKIVDPFAAGDPPQITKKTLEAIKQVRVFAGKGKLLATSGTGWDFGGSIKRVLEEFGLLRG